ncbi:ABC transporter substrate-binding protein [Kribbella sp. NPDC026611]|uniref:ABC transporter substrate-binding protein n=1 Tax=Kribbella sp. NPDC026611 TaxID=3154911 RepID=UPI0033FF1C58
MTIQVGALAPLTPPGWAEAGRHLVAGLELAVHDVNESGGIDGQPLELLVRETAADADRATAAVDEFADLGVAAVVGEYHSVVARAAAAEAVVRRLPFLCSSAVLDALTDEPTDWVARIAPPQSRGWTLYADYLRTQGHTNIAVITQPSIYWTAGTRILQQHLTVTELPLTTPADTCAELARTTVTAVLLLTGHPEPALTLAQTIRQTLPNLLIGAPAGQPELPEWANQSGAGIPFLRYLPPTLTPLGTRVAATLHNPSFVAFEGYDTILALADYLRANNWSQITTEGTRGKITFTRTPEIPVWQWTQPPIQVSDRDPANPTHFRTLHTG